MKSLNKWRREVNHKQKIKTENRCAKQCEEIKILNEKVADLSSKNKHLSDLLGNWDKEVEKLRNLLKESCNELKILRMLSLPLASQEALNECDVLLTRLHAALGESEEQ